MDCDNIPIVQLTNEDLEKLLHKQLGTDLKVESFTCKYLTKPGENYGSTILSIEVFYHKGENQLKKLSMVGKLVPQSTFLQEMFHVCITVKKEIRMYILVKPELDNLQKEIGIPESERIDVLPDYYGSQINKEEDMDADADNSAILLLGNLKLSGYVVGDRKLGLDIKHMELAITALAQLHALSIALKLLKPQIFNETVIKACEKYVLGKMDNDEILNDWINSTVGYVKPLPECIPYLERIEEDVHKYFNLKGKATEPPPREPFATLVHNDFWVNNIMFKYQKSSDNNSSIPVKVKIVDFQLTTYASPVRDLIFLLFTSSEEGLVEKHYDYLISLYHKEFLQF
ncbi:hypothetical protein L9F63_015443 [Diploptera punctata]|uniref:CHK kinase-like domain-containing protein n=1 Tax=Diploptera punctata TaxID=6984 RepID=A0AAD8A582_DIPPU|nr:hypothetical protein L9F63_015443 [Diploptera punctata]